MSAGSGAEKPRAGKRGRWDMQQTPDVHAPAAKKSAWDEVRQAQRNSITPECVPPAHAHDTNGQSCTGRILFVHELCLYVL